MLIDLFGIDVVEFAGKKYESLEVPKPTNHYLILEVLSRDKNICKGNFFFYGNAFSIEMIFFFFFFSFSFVEIFSSKLFKFFFFFPGNNFSLEMI